MVKYTNYKFKKTMEREFIEKRQIYRTIYENDGYFLYVIEYDSRTDYNIIAKDRNYTDISIYPPHTNSYLPINNDNFIISINPALLGPINISSDTDILKLEDHVLSIQFARKSAEELEKLLPLIKAMNKH